MLMVHVHALNDDNLSHAHQINKKSNEREENAYLKAGSVAAEVLSSIRTVLAFGGEHREEKRLCKGDDFISLLFYVLKFIYTIELPGCQSV